MSILALLLVVLGQVNLPLAPQSQFGNANSFVTVDLRAEAGSPQSVAAIDAILSWNPAELTLITPVASSYPWFVAGFLPDPDGINADVLDGTALYTALPAPGSPLMLPPNIVVASFTFKILTGGKVSLLPSVGTFGKTRVISTTPGLEITGVISGPVCIGIPGTWDNLGLGMAGTGGLVPVLVGTGPQACEAITTITLTNARPNSQAWLPIGATYLGLACKGGTLVPQLDLIIVFTTSPTGDLFLASPWPVGVPPGFEIYYQVWVKDPGGVQGFAASNGMRSTTG